MILNKAILGSVLFLGAVAGGHAWQTAPYVPKQSDRPEPVIGDEPGFTSIFDGKTLAGWEGNPTVLACRERRAGRRNHARNRHQEQHLHRLARREAQGFRVEARLPDHTGGEQRHQLPQRDCSRRRDAREQVRHARLPVRPRRAQAVPGQQLRREGAPLSRRPRTDDACRRWPAAGAGLDDRRHRRAGASRDRRLERGARDCARQRPHAHHQRSRHDRRGR